MYHPQIPEFLLRSVLLKPSDARRNAQALALRAYRVDYVEIGGRVHYDRDVLHAFIRKNTRVPSVRARREETRGAI